MHNMPHAAQCARRQAALGFGFDASPFWVSGCVQPPNRSLRDRCYGAAMPWDPFREAEGGTTAAAAAATVAEEEEEEATVGEEAVQVARRAYDSPALFPDDGRAALESLGAMADGGWTQTAQEEEEGEFQEEEAQEEEEGVTADGVTVETAQMDVETTLQTERDEVENLQVRSSPPFGRGAGVELWLVK